MSFLKSLNIDINKFNEDFVFPSGSNSPLIYVISSHPDKEDVMLGSYKSKVYSSFFKILSDLNIKEDSLRYYFVSPFTPKDSRGLTRALDQDEIRELSKFVLADINKTKPKVILCLGRIPAFLFTNEDNSIRSIRHLEKDYNGIPIVFTYSSNYFSSSESFNEKDYKSWISDINRAYKYEEFKSKKDSINDLKYDFLDISEVSKLDSIFNKDEKIVLDYEASSLRPILNPNFHIGGVGLYGMDSKKAVYIYIHDFFRRYLDFEPEQVHLDLLGNFLKSRKLIVFNAQYECNATAKYFNVEIRDIEDVMMITRMLSETGGLKEISSRKLHLPIWTSNIDVWNDALENIISRIKKRKKPKKEEYEHVSEVRYLIEENKTIFHLKTLIESKVQDSEFKILKDSLKKYLLKSDLDKPIVKESNISIFKFWSKIHSEEFEYFQSFKSLVCKRGLKITDYNIEVLPKLKTPYLLSKVRENCLSLKDVEILRAIDKFSEVINSITGKSITGANYSRKDLEILLTKYIIHKIEVEDYDINYSEIPVQIVAPYCVNDVIRTGELYEVIMEEIEDKKLKEASQIYMDQGLLAVELENNGIAWDDERASELEKLYSKILLDSGKDIILASRMQKVLQLSQQDILTVQSATSLDVLTKYFNPLSTLPSAGTRGKLSRALSSVRFRITMMMYEVHKEIAEVGLNNMNKVFPVLFPLYENLMKENSTESRLNFIDHISKIPDFRSQVYNSSVTREYRHKFKQQNYFDKYYNFELESMSSESIDDIFNGFVTILKLNPDDKSTWLEEFSIIVNFKVYKRAIKFLGTYIQAKLGRNNVYISRKNDLEKSVFSVVGSYEKGDRKSEDQVYINFGEYSACTAETRRWRAGAHTVPSGVSLMDLRISRYDDGCRLHFDYSQMEVRVLAKLANDKELLTLFEDESADIHRMIASKVFKKDPKDITDTERKFAKSATFGILYGKSVHNFAEELLNGDIRYAEEIFNSLFGAFPGIQNFIKSSHWDALNTGKVATIFGDELSIGMPDLVFNLPNNVKVKLLEDPYSDSVILSSNDVEDNKIKQNIGKALRNAQNWRIQSSASSIAGVCIYNISKYLKQINTSGKVDCFTHDAGDIDLRLNDLPVVLQTLKREAIEVPKQRFGIPVNIDFAIGTSGNHLLDLSDCIVSEDRKTITTNFSGKKKGFEILLERFNKSNIKVSYEIEKEEDKHISLKELFKPKGEYSLGEDKFIVIEGKMTLNYS